MNRMTYEYLTERAIELSASKPGELVERILDMELYLWEVGAFESYYNLDGTENHDLAAN